jgi:hypothetical protein
MSRLLAPDPRTIDGLVARVALLALFLGFLIAQILQGGILAAKDAALTLEDADYIDN